jgi:hypothetical protein
MVRPVLKLFVMNVTFISIFGDECSIHHFPWDHVGRGYG